jgi:hypothetical protein
MDPHLVISGEDRDLGDARAEQSREDFLEDK